VWVITTLWSFCVPEWGTQKFTIISLIIATIRNLYRNLGLQSIFIVITLIVVIMITPIINPLISFATDWDLALFAPLVHVQPVLISPPPNFIAVLHCYY